MFLGDSIKLLALVLAGRTSEGFFDLVVVVILSSLDVFTFSGYFSFPPALHPGFSGPWRSPPSLSSTLAIFGYFTFTRLFRHIFTASATLLSVYFLPTGVFYSAFLPHILARLVTQMRAGTPHRGSSPCPHRFVLSGWCLALNYSYCSYKAIGLSIAPVSHEV